MSDTKKRRQRKAQIKIPSRYHKMPGSIDVPAWRIPMQLHMVRGSFFAAGHDSDGSAAAICMDAEVWSRLPEELVWEVLRFVPATKHFQLHLVSRKWRQVLTFAHFQSRVASAAAAAGREQQHQSQRQDAGNVVAFVALRKPLKGSSASASASSNIKAADMPDHGQQQQLEQVMKVLDTDLSSLVPNSFWLFARFWARASRTDSYSVVATGDGLVCVSENLHDPKRYCVLNPLTRTCRVLPPLPSTFLVHGWLPLTSIAVTVFVFGYPHPTAGPEVQVATYDLTALTAATNGAEWDLRCGPEGATGTTTAGCTCWRTWIGPGGPGGGRRRLVEAAAVDQPSLEVLGLDAFYLQAYNKYAHRSTGDPAHLVAVRGAVYLVKMGLTTRAGRGVLVALWRLERAPLLWEAVAALRPADVERLTGLKCYELGPFRVAGAPFGMRELVCCDVEVGDMRVVVGFNLDTEQWEVVHRRHKDSTAVSRPFELRLDLFL